MREMAVNEALQQKADLRLNQSAQEDLQPVTAASSFSDFMSDDNFEANTTNQTAEINDIGKNMTTPTA